MAKIKSFGVEVSVAGNDIGGLTDVNLSGTEVSFIDVTTHDSPDGFKEFVGGLKDGGTIELTGAFDIADTGQTYLRNDANQGGDPVAVVVTFSDGTTASCDCVVGPFTVANPQDDKVEFSSTLKVSGAVTYAAGA